MIRTAIQIDAERRACERGEIAIVLLLVQSVLGLLTLLGTIVAAAFFPVISPAGLLVVAGFLVPLCCAIGVARGWRWGQRLTLIYQGFLLFSLWLNLVLDLLPPIQVELTLTGLVTGALLPVAVLVLVRTSAPEASTECRPLPAEWRARARRPALVASSENHLGTVVGALLAAPGSRPVVPVGAASSAPTSDCQAGRLEVR